MIRNEKGIALVLSLFLMAAMSVIAASLMFLSQTETYSSMNYRLMSQARYGAESGIQKTTNYLVYTYSMPGNTGNVVEPTLASYDTTASPVKFGAAKVYLSSTSNCATAPYNYPVQAVQNAFCAAAYGTLPSGTTTVSYSTTATLLSMQQVQVYGGGLQTIQTWQITSDGTISAGKTATVEVAATIEMQKLPATMYAAFATDGGCGALTFSGSTVTKSYDSSAYNGSGSITAANGGLTSSGGNVGTNGNLGESGTATIDGTLSSPRVGVGDCSTGNVDALSSSGNAKLCPDPNVACSGIQTGSVVQLPQAVTMSTPTAPNPVPPTTDITINSATSCANLGLTSPVCTGAVGNLTIIPSGTLVLGNVSLLGNANVTLHGGTYNLNSINVSANSNLIITPNTGNVVMNIAGSGQSTPIDFAGNSLSNPSYKPAEFQMQYAGTGNIVLNGNSTAAAMIYAPNAIGTLNGTDDFYGSIVTKKLTVSGNANLYYDRSLTGTFFTTGAGMMSAFSWKKY